MAASHDTRTDADLVGAYLTGDSAALGALYDRFAPGLYDTARAMLSDRDEAADVVQDVFCVAAAKLGQLRERDRVKPWLYSIARHEVFRRTRRRRQVVLGRDESWDGSSGDGAEWAAAPDPLAEGAAVESAELAAVVREAARGLEPSDQLLLELSIRQGLAGDALAAAMGVTLAQSHSMLYRMRDRVERAVGAYVVARGGRQDCPDLAVVLSGWDGTFNVLWRKRIGRHIDNCDACTVRRKAAVSLVGLAPAFAAPAWLRDATLQKASTLSGEPRGYSFRGDGGFPVAGSRRLRFGTRAAATTTAVAIVTIAIALAFIAGVDDDDLDESVEIASTAADSPAAPTLANSTSTTSTTIIGTTTVVSVTTSPTTVAVAPPLTPPGGPSSTADVSPPTQPVRPTTPVAPAVTTTTTTPILLNEPPGPTIGQTPTLGIVTTTIANQAPRLSRLAVSPSSWSARERPRSATVSASAVDDHGVASVTVTWSGQGSGGSATLSGNGTYSGTIGPVPAVAGSYSVEVTATDTNGATSTSSTKFAINAC